MNYKLCHTCQYEHTQIACSGCECDNDEYVQAKWFTEKEAEIRTDERKKFAEWLMKSKYIFVGRDGFTHDFHEKTVSLDEVLAEYEKEQKGETE